MTKIFKTISLAQRPITGPIQFGDDFPGVFIRGDDALSYAATLRRALESLPTIDDARLAKLAELTELLGSCRITRS